MAIQRIEAFISQLRKIEPDPILVETLCNQELAYLRNAHTVKNVPTEEGIFEGLGGYKKDITAYRYAIWGLDENHIARQYFKMNEFDSQNMTYQNGKSRMRNFKNRIIRNKYINNIDGYITKSVELLTATSYIDNILGLAALTGRRIAEIGNCCHFELSDYEEFIKSYHIFSDFIVFTDLYGNKEIEVLYVDGLAKKETYMTDRETKKDGIIPVLYDATTILDAFNDLRKRKTFRDNEHFHNAANKDLSIKAKKHYTEFLGHCSSHDLRKAYARICFDAYMNISDEDAKQTFYSAILLQNVPDNYDKFSYS
jgi:hypothetical protein